jgi:hypothetical protein
MSKVPLCLFGQSFGLHSRNSAGVERDLVASDDWSRTACRVYVKWALIICLTGQIPDAIIICLTGQIPDAIIRVRTVRPKKRHDRRSLNSDGAQLHHPPSTPCRMPGITSGRRIDDHLAQTTAEKAVRGLLADLKKVLPRTEGNGWKLSKFHEHLHLVYFITEFGSPRNFHAGRSENHHINVCKKPAETAQKRHAVFTEQVAERLADTQLINHASRKMAQGKSLPKTMLDLAHAETYLHPPAAAAVVVEGAEELTLDEVVSAGSSGGASRFFLKNDDSAEAEIRLYLYSARTSRNRPAMAYDEVPKDLIAFLLVTYYNNGNCTLNKPEYVDLEFVSEYTRDETRFRGHWNFRSNGPWNDWAYVDWGEDGKGWSQQRYSCLQSIGTRSFLRINLLFFNRGSMKQSLFQERLGPSRILF